MNKIFRVLLCLIGHHEWTAASLRGEEPNLPKTFTLEEWKRSFREHSRMYCKHCGYNSELNNWEWMDEATVWIELFDDLDDWARTTKGSGETEVKIKELKNKYKITRK